MTPAFPFPSLLLLLNWDLIFFCTWLYSNPLWSPLQISHLRLMGSYWNCAGQITTSFLPHPMAFYSYFSIFDFHARFTRHHWVVRALRIRVRNLGVVRLLMSNTNEYSWVSRDMVGPVFREVFLQVREEGLNWKESEGEKKAVGRLWQIMTNQVKTAWQKGTGMEMPRKVDFILLKIFLFCKCQRKRVLSEILPWEERKEIDRGF